MTRFLLVEDDAPVARTVGRVLEPFGPVVAVATCRDAFDAIRMTEAIAGAIIDVGLPDGSGVSVAEHLRDRSPRVEILVLTGHVSRDLVARVFDLRAEYLLKPVDRQRIGEFARRAASAASSSTRRLQLWARKHGLSDAETEVLDLYLSGVPRSELAAQRDVKENTIKRQITHILEKTGYTSLDALALELLRRDLRRR